MLALADLLALTVPRDQVILFGRHDDGADVELLAGLFLGGLLHRGVDVLRSEPSHHGPGRHLAPFVKVVDLLHIVFEDRDVLGVVILENDMLAAGRFLHG